MRDAPAEQIDGPAATDNGALPVTVCMIVLNEADRLERCLAGLSGEGFPGFAEVILLDTGSTDDTVALAQSLGARVEVASWEGFAGSRRRVFELASTPWIFWLDADEVMTDELRAAFHALFAGDGAGARVRAGAGADAEGGADAGAAARSGPPADVGGYEINRMVELDGQWIRHGDWFPDWNLRLFRAGAWRMEDRLVHESIRVDGRVERLAGLLEHHSFRDWADLQRRSERYAGLWAEQERKRGRRTFPLLPELRGLTRFVRGFVLRGGFLDGAAGFGIARQVAGEVRMKHALLRGGTGTGTETGTDTDTGTDTGTDTDTDTETGTGTDTGTDVDERGERI